MIVALTIALCGSSVEHKYTCILLVIKDFVKAILAENSSSFGSVTMLIQIVRNGTVTVALCEHLKDRFDRLCLMLIDDKPPVFADIITQRGTTACMLALQGSFLHALHDFTSQVSAIIFCHTFKDAFHHD